MIVGKDELMDIDYLLRINNFKGFKCDTIEKVTAFNEEVSNMTDEERWESICDVVVLRTNIMSVPWPSAQYLPVQSFLTEANDQLITYAIQANPKIKPKTTKDMRAIMQRLTGLDNDLAKDYGDIEKVDYGKMFEDEIKKWTPIQ